MGDGTVKSDFVSAGVQFYFSLPEGRKGLSAYDHYAVDPNGTVRLNQYRPDRQGGWNVVDAVTVYVGRTGEALNYYEAGMGNTALTRAMAQGRMTKDDFLRSSYSDVIQLAQCFPASTRIDPWLETGHEV